MTQTMASIGLSERQDVAKMERPSLTGQAGFPSLAVLIPVYNSASTIRRLVDRVIDTLSPHFERLEVVLVNDGSKDNSHAEALATHEAHPGVVRYVRLARNFGEHNAVMCGLRYVTADCVAIIDDDFQNPPEEILKLVECLGEGHDVAYSYYVEKHHHWFRNMGSAFNDWVATKMLNKPKGLYLSSFKAMNRFLIDAVTSYDGPYPYIDGLVLRATDAIGTVECAHQAREEGRSNYTLRKLVRLWLNMFTSFSILPLRASTMLGFAMSTVGFLMSIVYVITRVIEGPLFLEVETQ